MREPDQSPKQTPEQRRESVEYFALQALFRWPALARELELTAQHFRGSAQRSALAKAALGAQFLTPQGSVPVQTTAATAGVPFDWAFAQFTGGLFDPAQGKAWLVELVVIERAHVLRKRTEEAFAASTPEELPDALQAVLLEHIRRCNGKRGQGPVPTLQRIALDYIDARQALAAEGKESAVPFGPTLPRLGKLLRGGHHRGEVTLLTAGPGVGKTTFSRYLELQATRQGFYALHFSGEMSRDQHAERFVHAESRVAMSDRLQAGDLQRARSTIETSESAARVLVDVQGHLNPDHMLSMIIAANARYGALGLVTVDHLGKVEDARRREHDDRKEWELFSAMIKSIKAIALETDVPIDVLQHMTKAAGANEDPKWEPTADVGRGGGGPEREADNQIAIWRNSSGTWAKILKCRQNGEARNAKVELVYNSSLQSFVERETHDLRS